MSAEHALAQLRHLYAQLLRGHVEPQSEAARFLLGPAVEELERLQADLVTRPTEAEARRLRSELEEARGAHIDLLMDVWQQFALPVPEVMAGRSGVAMDGGLSTLEDLAEALVAAGRLVLVSDKYDWYAPASVGGGDAGKGEG